MLDTARTKVNAEFRWKHHKEEKSYRKTQYVRFGATARINI